MATVTRPSTPLPDPGDEMDAEQVRDWITNLLTFLESTNIDEANVDLTSTDGIMGKSTAQTVTGKKTFESTNAAAAGIVEVLELGLNPSSGTAADNDGGRVVLYADDDGGNATDLVNLDWVLTDASNGSEDAEFRIRALKAGTMTEFLTAGSTSAGTGRVAITGDLAVSEAATVGGGYGSTGVTISTAGVIQANGAITSDGAVTGATLAGTISTAAQNSITSASSLATVGTITSGTWSGVIDGTATITMGSDATGDIYYRNASGYLTRLAAGADGTVLTGTGSGSVPAWESPTVGDITSVVAGVGLSGGGTSGDVTLTLDISELSTVTPADGDFFATLDSDGANEQKTTTTALATLFAGAGMTATSAVLNVIGGDGITANSNDVAITATQTTVTSVLNASLAVGRDADNQIKFGTDDQIIFEVAGGDGVTFKASGEIEATSLDISGDADIDGTTNLDAVDIDGAVQIDGTVTVGVDDTGKDVKFFGASAGAYMEWDESVDQLRLMGASADATTSTGKLLLATSLTDINANDVLGKIDFQAPHEAGGTDAITIAASIQAIAQGTFSASVNATDLIFYTGHSEAATEKFRFTSQGELGVGGANYGNDGQVLTSTGAGTAPAWETPASSGATLSGSTDNTVATVTGANALQGEANLTFDGSTLAITGSMTLSSTSTISGDMTFVDNAKVTLGTGGDADIYYDATDLIINPKVAGSGKVGIGNLTPTAHTNNSLSSVVIGTSAARDGLSIITATTGKGQIAFGDGDSDASGGAAEWQGIVEYDHSSDALKFYTRNYHRMTILGSGDTTTSRVGIGTTPTKKLQVKVDGGADDGLSFVTDGDHTTNEYFCIGGGTPSGYSAQMRFMRGGTDGFTAESARFNTSGFLGINNTAPTTFLHVTETGSVGQHTTYFDKTNASAAGNVAYWSVNRADSTAYNFLSAANSGGQSILLTGDGNGKADGTWQDNVYDYAEYFESVSGEASELGRSVVLDDGKMRYYDASTDDATNIIGITRPKKNAKGPSIHNVAWNGWHERYVTDDFGQYAMEDVTVWSWDKIDAVEASEAIYYANSDDIPDGKSVGDVKTEAVEAVEGREEGGVYERDELAKDPDWTPPADATSSTQSVRKQNPDYDPALADDYKSREDRDEWWLIGLLGQVQIKSDEPTNPRWIKMKSISDAVDMWMIR